MTKIAASGTSLSYSTYLGGGDNDSVQGIAVDSAGYAHVTGYTNSSDFPKKNAMYGSKKGGTDVFVTKIAASGKRLSYSTYLGGSNDDMGYGIAVDSARNAYVTGGTRSSDFPMSNAIYESNKGIADVFVTKIAASGTSLSYSTYLGGSNNDFGLGIAVDSARNAYVTGETYSTDFPMSNAIYGSNKGIADVFVTKIAASGTSLSYSTYLGGSNNDVGLGIAVDSAGNAYVTGETHSTDFPMSNAIYGSIKSGNDAFVTKIGEPIPEPTPTPSPSPEPTPSPSPAPECKLKKIAAVKEPKQLMQGQSGTITVTLTAKKGCIPIGKTVTVKVVVGNKKLEISPASKETDSECKAEFTMTAAADKKGIATVRFMADKLKKDVNVKVKKGS